MARLFEKIPVRVEAMQFDGSLQSIMDISFWSHRNVYAEAPSGRVRVNTKEGHSYPLKASDWIIRGVEGEYYPCDDQIFRKTYKEVE